MHSKFKLTLAALAVSVVLTGCKSSQGPSVVAKNSDDRVIKLNAETEDKKKKPQQSNLALPPKNHKSHHQLRYCLQHLS